MGKVDATALAEITFADPTEEGNAVVFGFKDHQGREQNFACSPEAISIIVARLLGAVQRCATIRQLPSLGIVVKKSSISIDEENRTVILALYPTKQTAIPFVLSPQHAQKISSDLAHAASKVHPQEPKKMH